VCWEDTDVVRRNTGRATLVVLVLLAGPQAAFAWQESDFPPLPVKAYFFSLDERNLSTLIGQPRSYTFAKGDTLYDVARHLGLGINAITEAFPGLDVWLPAVGTTLEFPTSWVLPDTDHQGIVVNIPEMRVYYFPSHGRNARTAITYPVGLGRDDWRTPTGRFTVTEKTIDPQWIIPDSIRAEHLRDRRDPRRAIAGGDPANPLGHYRMRLSLPLYGIHGTNVPWGVGMQVSHGCVRLYPEDIEPLFAIVPVGTVGQLVYQPVKIGARDGDIHVEVHADIYETGFDYMGAATIELENNEWSALVDWGRLTDALQSKRGVPTRISQGGALRRRAGGETEGSRRSESSKIPRSVVQATP
jgi:L,D-transpeptidase ErfK/SrfK